MNGKTKILTAIVLLFVSTVRIICLLRNIDRLITYKAIIDKAETAVVTN